MGTWGEMHLLYFSVLYSTLPAGGVKLLHKYTKVIGPNTVKDGDGKYLLQFATLLLILYTL